jgi:ribonuclease HI
MRVVITTDGMAKPNPGKTRIGVIVENDTEVLSLISEYSGFGTSNTAEYSAVLRGLKEAKSLGATIAICYTDSQLVERQLNGVYRVSDKRLRVLHARIKDFEDAFTTVRYRWHSREAGRGPQADALAAGGEKAADVYRELIGSPKDPGT